MNNEQQQEEMDNLKEPFLMLIKNDSEMKNELPSRISLTKNKSYESLPKDDEKNLNSTFLSNLTNSIKGTYTNFIDKGKGHIFNLVSILAFFISNILTKVQYLYAPSLTVELSQMYRSIIVTLLSIFHIYFNRNNLNFEENWNNKRILFLNSLFGNIIYVFYMLACFYLRLGTANALLYSYPLFSFLFAHFILKEKVSFIDIVGLIVGFVSILMIVHFGSVEKPFESKDLLNAETSTFQTTMLGILFGVLTAICISAKSVVCKKSAQVDLNLHFLLFWLGLFGVLSGFAAFMIFPQKLIINLPICLISIVLGTSSYYANVFLLESFKHITLIESLIPGFLTILFSFIIGKYTFNNSFDWLDILGSLLLIVFSYFYIRHKVYLKDHKTS